MNETRTLATFIAESGWSDIPGATRHEGKRALLNWLGCALGGCRDETVDREVACDASLDADQVTRLVWSLDRLDDAASIVRR